MTYLQQAFARFRDGPKFKAFIQRQRQRRRQAAKGR